MMSYEDSCHSRKLKNISIEGDFVVVGGGLAGVCAAITAARNGLKTILVQDRPVLGGNASSEVRLWALGATSHQGNNNRFSREGGVIDEIVVENVWRNPEGNPVLFDMVLIDKVRAEDKIVLLLNTSVCGVRMVSSGKIAGVDAINFQNSTSYTISAPLFCDASGDGILAYMAGASFRKGAETADVYGEKLYLGEEYCSTLGHTIFFYSKVVDHPVRFVAPDLAIQDVKSLPKYHFISATDMGCRYWWVELGGQEDTVYDTEDIKFRLWSIVYGIWNHIKNSGEFENMECHTLEWVGLFPGKRESRRFVGMYTLKQDDIVTQFRFPDAVAYGGWAIDLHPEKGVYSNEPSCRQFHTKGIYSIPYRCLVAQDVENLFLGGRTISASHIAYGSVRVMMTLSHCAQAIGMAAALCCEKNLSPAELYTQGHIPTLQNRLSVMGQGIPYIPISQELIEQGTPWNWSSSSQLRLGLLPFDGGWRDLALPAAQILPLEAGARYSFAVETLSDADRLLEVSLRYSSKRENYTPDVVLERLQVRVPHGQNIVRFSFDSMLPEKRYAFLCFDRCKGIRLRESKMRVTGIVSVFQRFNSAVASASSQIPPEGSGIDSFDFWLPERRPSGANLALEITPSLDCFGPENLSNGYVRPYTQPNAFVADPNDLNPLVTLNFGSRIEVRKVTLFFDTDYDHPMESVQMGHPERVMPFCVRDVDVLDGNGRTLARVRDNYQTRRTLALANPVETDCLQFVLTRPSDRIPAALYQILINL